MIDDAKIAQMRKACNGSKNKNKPWAGMMHDLLDEIERLRAKCKERKAALVSRERHDEFKCNCAYCHADLDEGLHAPDCAWKRAMEDV